MWLYSVLTQNCSLFYKYLVILGILWKRNVVISLKIDSNQSVIWYIVMNLICKLRHNDIMPENNDNHYKVLSTLLANVEIVTLVICIKFLVHFFCEDSSNRGRRSKDTFAKGRMGADHQPRYPSPRRICCWFWKFQRISSLLIFFYSETF